MLQEPEEQLYAPRRTAPEMRALILDTPGGIPCQLAADAVYAARYGLVDPNYDRWQEEWRELAGKLFGEHGKILPGGVVLAEMDAAEAEAAEGKWERHWSLERK